MTLQATTPFVSTSLPMMLGQGAPIVAMYDVTALTATGTITLALANAPVAAPVPYMTQGRLRIKTSAVNAATTIAIGNLTGTDGTNTVTLRFNLIGTATAAGTNVDFFTEFKSDLNLISISFTVTLAGGTTIATINSEMFANP